MLLLAGFALIAGAGTALSPCVLPILPAVLSAGVTGGRRRPLGIVTGLALSFTFAAVALVYLIDALGLPDDVQRIIAIVVLAGFGIALVAPPIGDRIEAWISRLVGAPRMRSGEGFGSGLILGGALGLAYFPCAGPILAGVITVSVAQDFTAGRLMIALSYAIGSAAVLYAMLVFGRRFTDRLKGHQRAVQTAMGVVMIAVAMLMSANLDVRFQNAIADELPAFLTNPTAGLQESDAIASGIQEVNSIGGGAREGGAAAAARGSRLPVLGAAPEITDPGEFFNTDGEPVSIAELTAAGKTVLVDFWTYTCINCIRTFPELRSWHERYSGDGLVVVGVHTPEFPFERDPGNVAAAIERNDLAYPVVQDNDFGTWNAFGNQYWPAKYLIDSGGKVRYAHFGEGEYEQTEDAIRSLLAEERTLGSRAGPVDVERIDPGLRTPETYLGAARAQGWTGELTGRGGSLRAGTRDYGEPQSGRSGSRGFAYSGVWNVSDESATAVESARIDATFTAKRVFLVLGSAEGEREARVLLDGRPIPDRVAGRDVDDGRVTIGPQRLYDLVELRRAGTHSLTLEFEPGVSGYAFTFG